MKHIVRLKSRHSTHPLTQKWNESSKDVKTPSQHFTIGTVMCFVFTIINFSKITPTGLINHNNYKLIDLVYNVVASCLLCSSKRVETVFKWTPKVCC